MTQSTAPQTWTDLQRPTPEWFRRAPFGIFFHWGPYSVPAWAEPSGELGTLDDEDWFLHNAYAEWYYNTIRLEGSPAQKHHHEVYGGADYDDFLDQWKAEYFDAAEWMDLCASAGADYVVPTTKHHDGITLWEAPGTGTRNTVHRGPRRDLIAEIARAAKDRGLRLGLYYSGGLDWHVRHLAPHTSGASVQETSRPKDAEFAQYVYTHVQDLVDRFGPDILWNDINWPDEGKHFGEHGLGELFRSYYEHHPEGVVNDRWGRETHYDFSTAEYQNTDESAIDGPWEHCRGVGLSFGYNQMEGDEQYMTGRQISRYVGDVVSRGGRVLLNIGPRADGTIPEAQRTALLETGRWMAVAKPHLAGAVQSTLSPASEHGWVRALTSDPADGDGSTILLVDAEHGSDGRAGRATEVTEVTVSGMDGADLNRLTNESAEWSEAVAESDGSIAVTLSQDRPGPAVLRIS